MSARYSNERYAFVADRTRRRLEREGLRLVVGRGTAYRPGERTAWQLFCEILGDACSRVVQVAAGVVRFARAVDAAMFHDDNCSRYISYACGTLAAVTVLLFLLQHTRIAQ